MRSSVTDIASGLFSLLVVGVFYSQGSDLEGVSRMYPMLLLGFIALGGVYLLAQGLFKRRPGCDKDVDAEPVTMSRVGIITAVSIAYVILIPLLGFYVTSGLFLFGAAMILNDAGGTQMQRAISACVLMVVMCLAVWGGFALLLSVPTPEGVLF